jgi:hypothetical protein
MVTFLRGDTLLRFEADDALVLAHDAVLALLLWLRLFGSLEDFNEFRYRGGHVVGPRCRLRGKEGCVWDLYGNYIVVPHVTEARYLIAARGMQVSACGVAAT